MGIGMTSPLCLLSPRTPRSLFRSGDVGFWFDPSAVSTVSQDSAGILAVSKVGQSVGRILDRSGKGLHATQVTAGLRPLYARIPAGGRRNMLTNTDNLTLWALQGTPVVTADGTLGGEPSFRLTDNDTAQWEAVTRSVPTAGQVSGPHTLTVRLKKETAATSAASARVNVFDGSSSRNAGFIVNPMTGITVTGSAWSYGGRTATVVDQGDHWLIALTFSVTTGHVITSFQIFPGHFNLNASSSATINTGSNSWAAPQLEMSAATPFQRVTSDADITEAGKSSRFALLNDLMDDALVATVPSGTYTVAYCDDAGVTILGGQVLSGAYTLPGPARFYGAVAINRSLSSSETNRLVSFLSMARP
jgi:hypothetical protein